MDQLEKDAMIMALRLLGEDEETFSPECYEVIKRWRPKAIEYFKQSCKEVPDATRSSS